MNKYIRYSNGKAISGSSINRNVEPKDGNFKRIFDELPVNDVAWYYVIGGDAGDGTITKLSANSYQITGPDDEDSDGWAYIKALFTEDTHLVISFNWNSDDEDSNGHFPPEFDRPIYTLDVSEPTGIPSDTISKVDQTPDGGVWYIGVPANYWFSVGIYSTDSCCGRGHLNISLYKECCDLPVSIPTTSTTTTAFLG